MMDKINKTKMLWIRISESDLEKVRELAADQNQTVSKYVRNKILK